MANILIYDPDSKPVAGRAVRYLRSANATEWRPKPNVLINPSMPQSVVLGPEKDIPLVSSPIRVVNGKVRELDASELAAVAAKASADAEISEAREREMNKQFATEILTGEGPYELYEQAKLRVEVAQWNELRTRAGLQPVTFDDMRASITDKINTTPAPIDIGR